MLNADRAPYFQTCPRCGEGGLEHLETHSHCVNCNYFHHKASDELYSIPDWVIQALENGKQRCRVRELKKPERELEELFLGVS